MVITSSHYICKLTDKRQKVEHNRDDPSDQTSEELNRHPKSPLLQHQQLLNRPNLSPKEACVISALSENVCVCSAFNTDCNKSKETQPIFLHQSLLSKSYHLFPNSLLPVDCHYTQANKFPQSSIIQWHMDSEFRLSAV